MASYIKTSLQDDEKILSEARFSDANLIMAIFLSSFLIPIMGAGLVFILGALIYRYTTELAITNKRLVTKRGLIKRSAVEINLDRIESVQIKQGYYGRLWNFGTIVASGAGRPVVKVFGVRDPVAFVKRLKSIQEEAAKTEGPLAA